MRIAQFLVSAGIAALIACRPDGGAAHMVTIDTLPGGIARTLSRSPIDSGRWHLVRERTLQPAEGAPGGIIRPT